MDKLRTLIELLEVLKHLSPDTQAIWGKMDAQHMVEHLIFTFRISNGKCEIPVFSPPDKLTILKRILMSARPLPRNFINPVIGEDLLPLEFNNLEEAKNKLHTEIISYYQFFEENPMAHVPNPTFGELNKEEWDIFHKKHIVHHFTQFGLE